MSLPPVPPIIVDRIGGAEVLHEPAPVSPRCFHQQMQMIAHEHVGVKTHLVAFQAGRELLLHHLPVGVRRGRVPSAHGPREVT